MTKKELEILVKEQSKQISDLISLVQNQKKETIIVKESQTQPWNPNTTSPWPTSPSYPYTPTSPINPWVTYCGTRISNNSSGSSLPNERWDKEPEMIKAWDKLGIIGHNKSEGMV